MAVPLTKKYLLSKKSIFLQDFTVKSSAFSQTNMCSPS